MQNTQKTFPDCEFSLRPRRLVFTNAESPRLREAQNSNILDVKNFPQLLREMKSRGKKMEDIQKIISANGADRTKKVKKLNDVWVGDKIIFKSKEQRARVQRVVTEAQTESGFLQKSVEAQKELKGVSKKCANSKSEKVVSLVAEIAQEKKIDPNLITEVSVRNRNGKKVTKLTRDGNDFVEVGGGTHFKIYKNDVVVIGHDYFSADQKLDDGSKIGVEYRQTRKDIRKGIRRGDQKIDFAKMNLDIPDLGLERANRLSVAKAISEIGIREIVDGLFVGEHGALAGIFLSESEEEMSLFDENGQKKEAVLTRFAEMLVATAGKVDQNIPKKEIESELLRDVGEFFEDLGLTVGVPTAISAIVAALTSAPFAIAGYFPLVNIDIGRGIKRTELGKFDKGDLDLLKDLSLVSSQIAALESPQSKNVSPQKTQKIKELKTEKTRLEKIAFTRKLESVNELLENNKSLTTADREKLETDQKALQSAIENSSDKNSITAKELAKHEHIQKDENEKYRRAQKTTRGIQNSSAMAGVANLENARQRVEKNLGAIETSLDEKMEMTRRIDDFWDRWFGGKIENPEEAKKELHEMMQDEASSIHSRNRYEIILGNTDTAALTKAFGLETGKEFSRKKPNELIDKEQSLLELMDFIRDPVGTEISVEVKKQMEENLSEEQIDRIYESFATYFKTEQGVSQNFRDDLSYESNPGHIELAKRIFESNENKIEQIYRLTVLANLPNLEMIDKQLTLKTNIENDVKIQSAFRELDAALESRGFIENLKTENPGLFGKIKSLHQDILWLENEADLKNLDQNASVHEKINNELLPIVGAVNAFSREIVKMAAGDFDPTELVRIENMADSLQNELGAKKRVVEYLLGKNVAEARESHRSADFKKIKNENLKTVNEKFSVPITEKAVADSEQFAQFANEIVGDGAILKNKKAFLEKMKSGFRFGAVTIQIPNYAEYKNRNTTSNLPMVSPENLQISGGDLDKNRIAQYLNLLILNVEQPGKNVADTFFENTELRAGMHIRDAELAEAVGRGKWLSQNELEAKYGKKVLANTGIGNVEDRNSEIAGAHGGGKFGGAWELEFTRSVSLANGRTFEIKYNTLARGKCFNAVFIPNGGIRETTPDIPPQKFDNLISVDDLAMDFRKLLTVGPPLYFKFAGEEDCYTEVGVGKGWESPEPPTPGPGPTPIPI